MPEKVTPPVLAVPAVEPVVPVVEPVIEPVVEPVVPVVEPVVEPAAVVEPVVEPATATDPAALAAANKALRDENAKNRIAARDAKANADAQAKAAADAAAAAVRDELRTSLAQAFGINQPEVEATPEELIAAANAQTQAVETRAAADAAAARASKIELAVYLAADAAGADAVALLDSHSFRDGFDTLDPAAESFDEQLTTKIAAALELNPRLRKAASRPAPVVPRSGGDLSAGNGEPESGKEDNSVAGLIAARRKRRGLK
jgi:hypothetical protein